MAAWAGGPCEGEDLELLDQGVDVIKPPPFDLGDLLDPDDLEEAPLSGMSMG